MQKLDTLHALILILHAKNRRGDPFPTEFAVKGKTDMTPDFRSVPLRLAKLQHNLNARAQKLNEKMDGLESRAEGAFGKAHAQLDVAESAVADVTKFVDDLEQSNGGPTLDGSQGPSKAAG